MFERDLPLVVEIVLAEVKSASCKRGGFGVSEKNFFFSVVVGLENGTLWEPFSNFCETTISLQQPCLLSLPAVVPFSFRVSAW